MRMLSQREYEKIDNMPEYEKIVLKRDGLLIEAYDASASIVGKSDEVPYFIIVNKEYKFTESTDYGHMCEDDETSISMGFWQCMEYTDYIEKGVKKRFIPWIRREG